LLGDGILKGMAETARNFFGSFVSAERLTTVEYRKSGSQTVEAARVFPFSSTTAPTGSRHALRGLPDCEKSAPQVHSH